jgi:flagellar motility protein MotE (MotC chaperone)
MEELRKQREEMMLEKKKLEDERKDLENRKVAVDELSRKLASETLNLESSLIRFMEQDNKMDQVRSIAAQMEPKSLSTIFDEVPDDKMIYEILSGLPPLHAGKILGGMDPEKAGKIMKLGQQPITLPPPGPARSYVPPSLQNLIDETQANLR